MWVVLQVAPSSYYKAKVRPPSARSGTDAATTAAIRVVHEQNYGLRGPEGARRPGAGWSPGARPAGGPVHGGAADAHRWAARCQSVDRAPHTIPGTGPHRPVLVGRDVTATAPEQLWVADVTYCRTFSGWVYTAFVTDVFSRRVVGWQLSRSVGTNPALDALEMWLWTRRLEGHHTRNLMHHSDKGVQYVAVRYTERLAEAGAVASVGSTGDPRTSGHQCPRGGAQLAVQGRAAPQQGPRMGIDDLKIAAAKYLDRFNHRRLHGETGLVPPAELETEHCRQNTTPAPAEAALQSLHQTPGKQFRQGHQTEHQKNQRIGHSLRSFNNDREHLVRPTALPTTLTRSHSTPDCHAWLNTARHDAGHDVSAHTRATQGSATVHTKPGRRVVVINMNCTCESTRVGRYLRVITGSPRMVVARASPTRSSP